MLVVIVAVVVLANPADNAYIYTNPDRVEEILANYLREMETNPSQKTAKKSLNFAIASQQPKMVFRVLKDHLGPWIATSGIEEEFFRGSKWYVESNDAQFTDVLWLAAELWDRGLADQFNENLADYYLALSGTEAVECGKGLFDRWPLTGTARQHYLQCLSELWAYVPLPLRSDMKFKGLGLIDQQGSPPLIKAPEFKDLTLYLELWARCWHWDIDGAFLDTLNGLSAESDPLGLYLPLRAVTLLQGLEQGWQNPLGLDVSAQLPQVFPILGVPEFKTLADLRDPTDRNQSIILLELAKLLEFDKVERYLPQLLANAAGLSGSDLSGIAITFSGVTAPEDVADLYRQLDRTNPYNPHLDKARVLLGLGQESPFYLEKSLTFSCDTDYVRFSPEESAVFIDSYPDSTLIDLVAFKTTPLPGVWGTWTPRGDRLLLLKPGNKPAVTFLTPSGKQISQFTLNTPLPLSLECGEMASLSWFTPWELDITYGDVQVDRTARLRLNLKTRTLREVSSDRFQECIILPNADLYFRWGEEVLFNDKGAPKGTITFPNANSCNFHGIELFIEDGVLMATINKTTYSTQEQAEEMRWVAAPEGTKELCICVYARAEVRYFALDRQSGKLETISPRGLAPVNYTIRQHGAEKEVRGRNWQYFSILPEFPHGIHLGIGGQELPLLLLGTGVRLHNAGDSYIVAVRSDDEICFLDYRQGTPSP